LPAVERKKTPGAKFPPWGWSSVVVFLVGRDCRRNLYSLLQQEAFGF